MLNKNNFLDIIESLDISIKVYVEKMNLPFPLSTHIKKDKKMDDEINKLLAEIKNKIPKTFESSIPYILSELTDNIEQHSNFTDAYLFLKYDTKWLEIVIFDNGLTIPSVFTKNNINYLKDSDALRMALEGKTTKNEDISRGYGLRTTNNIVKALKGEMQVISKKGMLILGDSKIQSIDFEKGILNGTLIYLKLKTPEKDLNIYPYLE